MSSGIRAFIALDLSETAKDALEAAMKKVRQQTAFGSVRWVKRPAYHLTLFFLGDGILPDKIEAVCDELDALGRSQRPFSLSLGELGCFPSPRKPSVLWVGIQGDTQSLQQIKTKVDSMVQPLGWRPEKRPYTPHLTLGRVQDQMGVVNQELPYGQLLQSASWQTDKIHLYHSQLTRQGAKYTKIHSAAFAAINGTLT